MILNEDQKLHLEEMKQSMGYKVLLEIEKEARNELFARLSEYDLDNQDNIKNIKEWQIYANARKDFIQNIEGHLKKVFVPKMPWEE